MDFFQRLVWYTKGHFMIISDYRIIILKIIPDGYDIIFFVVLEKGGRVGVYAL